MLTSLLVAGVLLASPQAPTSDAWNIVAGLAPKASNLWDVSLEASVQGEEHTATMQLGFDVADGDPTKPLKATYAWKSLTLDSGQSVPDQTWDVTLTPKGGIADSDSQDGAEAVKVMLTPMSFIFPDKAVSVGDTWSDTIKVGDEKDDHSITVTMKADSLDKVGDADALKVTETIDQKGDDGLKGDGTWWVDKAGKVLKFETKVKNWVVPMAGDQPMDASFKGTLAKPAN